MMTMDAESALPAILSKVRGPHRVEAQDAVSSTVLLLHLQLPDGWASVSVANKRHKNGY